VSEKTVRCLVRCDGARVPLEWRSIDWTITKDVDTDAASKLTANLVVRGIEQRGLGSLSSRVKDLIAIAGAIYRADQLASRGGGKDVHGECWEREFGLCIGVRDPEFWSAATIQERLASLVRFGTDDRWQFAFSEFRSADSGEVQTQFDSSLEAPEEKPGCVVLFSGGIDSLATLAEAAATGQRPFAVSHWSEHGNKKRQHNLLRLAPHTPPKRPRLEHWPLPSAQIEIHGKGHEGPERTRRARGVLFAALGIAAATQLDVDRIFLADNGPISLNLPVNDQVVGAHASRSTHPVFLERASAFATHFAGHPVQFSNPLWARTRAETLEILRDLDLETLIPFTLSCSNWRGHTGGATHCGYCSQCIDRRFATIAAGLETHDPLTRYRHDVFLDPLPTNDARMMALSYVRHAQRLSEMTPDQLIIAYPQLLEAAQHSDGEPESVLRELIDVVQRHATSVLDVMDHQQDAARDLRRRGKLSAQCLLATSELDAESLVDADARSIAPPQQIRTSDTAEGDEVEGGDETLFIRDGKFWTISYRGHTIHLHHGDGLTRMAYLLAHPRQEFTPSELLARTRTDLDPGTKLAATDERALSVEGWGGGGEVLDDIALESTLNEIRRLQDEIDDAIAVGNTDAAALLEEKQRVLEQYRSEGTSPGGPPKTFDDNESRKYDTVYKSLHRLTDRIREQHPLLSDHLEGSFKYGAVNCYKPKTPTHWAFVRSSQAA
jgi:7-cyano-7-deazaguanine synthase in queuosine biosynthesis